jgi:hypothetical protein
MFDWYRYLTFLLCIDTLSFCKGAIPYVFLLVSIKILPLFSLFGTTFIFYDATSRESTTPSESIAILFRHLILLCDKISYLPNFCDSSKILHENF